MSKRPFISSALGSHPTVPYPNAATARTNTNNNTKYLFCVELSIISGHITVKNINMNLQILVQCWDVAGICMVSLQPLHKI